MADINQNLKRANDGPLGQHVDENDQLVITGENNPLPSKDKDAHARLDAIEQALGGTLNTQLTGSNVSQPKTITDAQTADGFSTLINLNGADKVIVDINGDATSLVATFRARLLSGGTWSYKLGSKVVDGTSDVTVNSQATNTGEVWEITELKGYEQFALYVYDIAGGSVTINAVTVA